MKAVDRDRALADWLLNVVVDWDNNRPRSKQVTLGPSELGGCREYIRSIVENEPGLPETGFRAAAFMGSAVGDYLESVFVDAAAAITQLEIVCQLTRTGIVVAGSSDAIIPPTVVDIPNTVLKEVIAGGLLLDFKSKSGLATVEREGASLEHLVQLAAYLVGAVQMGVCPPTTTGALVYVDRGGNDKRFTTVSMDYEEALRWVDLAEDRLMDVQEVIARGSLEEDRWALRDKSPSWCFAVQCPFRENCWGGSEHRPTGRIEHPDELEQVRRYVVARDDEKDAQSRKADANRSLVGVTGITPDGTTVSWTPTGRKGPDDSPVMRLDVRVQR